MAYDEKLAKRLREIYGPVPHSKEQKGFGGIMFMVNGLVFVAPEGIKTKKSLTSWVQMSLDFVASLEPK